MEPCPWCVLQRLIFLAIGVLALIGLAWRSAAGARVAGTLVLLLALGGIAAALWQHFVAAKSQSCNLTLADKIITRDPARRCCPTCSRPRASCADAAVDLLGVPYALWAAIVFAALRGGLAARPSRR